MSLSSTSLPSDSDRNSIDIAVRSVISADRSADIPWEETAPKVAALVAQARIGTRIARLKGRVGVDGNSNSRSARRMAEDVGRELDAIIADRILTNDFSSKIDPDRVLDGSSVCGWAGQLASSAFLSVVRNINKDKDRVTYHNDQEAVFSVLASSYSDYDSDGERSHQALEMYETMQYGASEQERPGIFLLAYGWKMDLPYAWPQTKSVRTWVARNVSGPGDGLTAMRRYMEARAAGTSHPLDPMFHDWTEKEVADLVESNDLAAAWIKAAGAVRPGPPRSLANHLIASMLGASADPGWNSVVRRFVLALCGAMSGADRSFASKSFDECSDERLIQANNALWDAVEEVAEFRGAPYGTDTVEVVRLAIAKMNAFHYQSAASKEDQRMAARA